MDYKRTGEQIGESEQMVAALLLGVQV